MAGEPSSESWKKMVLRSMPKPAWLEPDAPDGDVVISSRHRVARNLVGWRYPHLADAQECRAVMAAVREAAERQGLGMRAMVNLTEAERDYLLGSRLISPEFQHREAGRMVLLDSGRVSCVMVNEEDHLRVQSVTAGWSSGSSEERCTELVRRLGRELVFQRDEGLGWLPASPSNLGGGERRSALFHLIGLGAQGRLSRMLRSLQLMGLVARGLFGESSRGVGAFIQVSMTRGEAEDFRGACTQLVREERMARRETRRDTVVDKVRPAVEYAISSQEVTLRDALLVLGYVRWASAIGLPGYQTEPRAVDEWIAEMEVFGTQDARVASRHRADFLRVRLESLR